MFLCIGTILFSSAVIASSIDPILAKRDSGVYCGNVDNCHSWYKTGLVTCSPGYKRTRNEVSGSTVGSYCSRACNNDERKACNQRQCDEALKGCNLYPAGESCRDALRFCNKPIKTNKSICTARFMAQLVKYDDKSGTCTLDESGAKPPWRATIDIGTGPVDLRLFMSCSPVTEAGAYAVSTAFRKDFSLCDKTQRKASTFDIAEICYVQRDKWEQAKTVVETACAKAEPGGNTKPIFFSNKY